MWSFQSNVDKLYLRIVVVVVFVEIRSFFFISTAIYLHSFIYSFIRTQYSIGKCVCFWFCLVLLLFLLLFVLEINNSNFKMFFVLFCFSDLKTIVYVFDCIAFYENLKVNGRFMPKKMIKRRQFSQDMLKNT